MLNFLNLFNFKRHINLGTWKVFVATIECVGWRRHSSLIFLILLFTKPNVEVSGWLNQTKTHFTHIFSTFFKNVTSILNTLSKPRYRTGTSINLGGKNLTCGWLFIFVPFLLRFIVNLKTLKIGNFYRKGQREEWMFIFTSLDWFSCLLCQDFMGLIQSPTIMQKFWSED